MTTNSNKSAMWSVKVFRDDRAKDSRRYAVVVRDRANIAVLGFPLRKDADAFAKAERKRLKSQY